MKKVITGILLALLCPMPALAQSISYTLYDYAIDKLLDETPSILPLHKDKSTIQRRRDGIKICTILSNDAEYNALSKQLREDAIKRGITDEDKSFYMYLIILINASRYICPENKRKINQINIDLKNDLKKRDEDEFWYSPE